MKLRLLAAALAALTLSAGAVTAQDTTSEKGKLSYYFGYDFGVGLVGSDEPIDINTVIKGLQDGYAKKEPAVKAEELRPAVEAYQKRQEAKAKAAKDKWDKVAAENKTKSDAFLAQNKAKSGVRTLPSGVQYRVVEPGNGAKPTQASTVQLQVAGPFPWGEREPQASETRPMPDIKISEVEMPAMREVLLQMPAGSRWEITLPADKAYGADPRTGFPPNMAVQFDVKLVSVK
jgi:peptidylprolyl isomerase